MPKTSVWTLCSIFSNDSHVFKWIKIPHNHFMQNNLRNIQSKFGSNWSSSFRREEFKKNKLKIVKKCQKGNNSNKIHMKIWLSQKVLEVYAKNFSLTLMFYFSNSNQISWKLKIPISVLCRITYRTFIEVWPWLV